jgi:hypothetical protein
MDLELELSTAKRGFGASEFVNVLLTITLCVWIRFRHPINP